MSGDRIQTLNIAIIKIIITMILITGSMGMSITRSIHNINVNRYRHNHNSSKRLVKPESVGTGPSTHGNPKTHRDCGTRSEGSFPLQPFAIVHAVRAKQTKNKQPWKTPKTQRKTLKNEPFTN